MKYISFVFLLAICGCDKNNDKPEGPVIGPPWPWEEECLIGTITSEQDIRDNLVGKWKLVGYKGGFAAPHAMPVSNITFTPTTGQIVYSDDFSGGQVTQDFTWTLIGGISGVTFVLNTDPPSYAEYLDTYCPNYISYDHSAFDGQAHQYKRQ